MKEDSRKPADSLSRSKRMYWVLGTVVLAAVLLTSYYSIYVSAQQAYYNERAFRLLSIMGTKLALEIRIAENVLKASAAYSTMSEAQAYVERVLHGKLEEQDFVIHDFQKVQPSYVPTRKGQLTFFLPSGSGFRVEADYRESTQIDAPSSLLNVSVPASPCLGQSPSLRLCATIDFSPLVRQAFTDLEEGFFDDVLVADSHGNVLFQESVGGIEVRNIDSLPTAKSSNAFSGSLFEKNGRSQAISEESSDLGESHKPGVVDVSSRREVELGGVEYYLFVQPLSLHMRGGAEDRSLLLCGLRSVSHSRAQALQIPYTYLIWTGLIVLALFSMAWPLLKLLYMSPKERLRPRHILYLIASILSATALLTLIALEASYTLTTEGFAKAELRSLAKEINANFGDELIKALNTLAALSKNESLLQMAAGNDWNTGNFLVTHAGLFTGTNRLPYPYFRYFFLADTEGMQRLKFTISPEPTPPVNVATEPFFHPVQDRDLSALSVSSGSYEFRMDPLYSPNTGEFLVVLAKPFDPGPSARRNEQFAVEVLATRFESLFMPVLPTGYGFAVVDPAAKVLFHSSSVRNLNENFAVESRRDAALLALLANGSSGFLNVKYMGTDKNVWVTPLAGLQNPRLTLITFKDASYGYSDNMSIVVVSTTLVLLFPLLPLFAVVLVHVIRRWRYPLEAIWPSCERKTHYIRIVVADVLLGATFFHRYVNLGLTGAVLSVFALVFTAAVYPFLECRSVRARWAGNMTVLAVMVVIAGVKWVLVFPLIFLVYLLHRKGRSLDLWLYQWMPLKLAYTLAAASMLVTLVVVPCCGFFKISYDYVQRLETQQKQLDLRDRIHLRERAIEDYYYHLAYTPKATTETPSHSHSIATTDEEPLASFKNMRLGDTLDRYDQVFLNCTPKNRDSRQAPLGASLVERTIVTLTSHFPLTPHTAKLRELAASEDQIPDARWTVSNEEITCQSGEYREALSLLGSGPRMVSFVPVWPALDWRVRLWLGFAIFGLAAWIHFVPSRLFLLDCETLPPLDEWDPKQPNAIKQNILLLGHPKSGKRLTAKQVSTAGFLDIAEMTRRNEWATYCSEDTVIVNHFEFGIDDPSTNDKKLALLESLMRVHHKRVILLSTVDPIYYLRSGAPDVILGDARKEMAKAIQLLDRWAEILASFRKVTINDITINPFHRIVARLRKRSRTLPAERSAEFERFVNDVIRECDHTAQLRKLGGAILNIHRRGTTISKEQLIEELLDRADAYYPVLWSTCTKDERLVLYQLAKDGWANPKNGLAIQQLQRRGLVLLPPSEVPHLGPSASKTAQGAVHAGLRVMNESFRRFVRNSQYQEEIDTWEQEEEQSLWRSLKRSLIILSIAVAAWLLYSQQQFFTTMVGYIGAIGAAIGVVYKLVSDLRGKTSSGTDPQ